MIGNIKFNLIIKIRNTDSLNFLVSFEIAIFSSFLADFFSLNRFYFNVLNIY